MVPSPVKPRIGCRRLVVQTTTRALTLDDRMALLCEFTGPGHLENPQPGRRSPSVVTVMGPSRTC